MILSGCIVISDVTTELFVILHKHQVSECVPT